MSLSINPMSKIVIEDVEKNDISRYYLLFDLTDEDDNGFPDTLQISKQKVRSCDPIKTLSLAQLIEKIKEVAKDIKLDVLKIDDSEDEYYQMPAKDSTLFFSVIRQLQDKVTPIFISACNFEQILLNLLKHHYLTSKDAKDFKVNIKTHRGFQDTIIQTRDVNGAVSLAYYYRNINFETTKKWLSLAKEYLYNSGKKLSSLINVDDFLPEQLEVIHLDLIELFEMDEKNFSSAKYRILNFKKCCYPRGAFERIGDFLSKTTLIEKVDFSPSNRCDSLCKSWKRSMLDYDTISPIANALLTNSSITELNLDKCRILDKGISEIANAIENNPKSNIIKLNLNSCRITHIGAEIVKNLIDKKEQILRINTDFNLIDWYLTDLEKMFYVNKIKLVNYTREFMLTIIVVNDLINIIFEYLDFPIFKKQKPDIDADSLLMVRENPQIDLTENEEEFNI